MEGISEDISSETTSSTTSEVEVSPSEPNVRRSRIPNKPKNSTLNLWSTLKNCVGKDLTQIAFPVNFSEPLSVLQRLTEELEYSELLDRAATCACPYEQLAYLAVFIISGYTNSVRSTKPFNPLLGETYEFDRRNDLGWRVISEQVSHHPPIAVQYCEGRGWILRQEFSMESKFLGNDIQITPLGEASVEFTKGTSYCWNKVITIIHNYLIGSLWTDLQGQIFIIGKGNVEGITCDIRFIPYSGMLSRSRGENRKVEGEVFDENGLIKVIIDGVWASHVDISWVLNSVKTRSNIAAVTMSNSLRAWKCTDPVKESENYYSFSNFACELNELEENVAPTDSRLRPDMRLMEEGDFESANLEKTRLEEKQREAVKARLTKQHMASSEGFIVEPYQPTWFSPIQQEDNQVVHVYRGTYWTCKEKQDWSMCPDIFS